MMDDSVLESTVHKQDTDGHSIEDVNWADSCLVKVSENEWDSLKTSLLEILDSVEPSADHIFSEFSPPYQESPELDVPEETINHCYTTSSDDDDDDKEDESTTDFGLAHKKYNKLRSRTNAGNSSMPVIHEFQDTTYDFGFDFNFMESIPEPTAGEIFKVWDLDIPHEEDELLTNLNKAIVDSPLLQSVKDNDLDLNGFSNYRSSSSSSIDEVIMGMTDLCLDSNPNEVY